ncbi:MAG: DUF983 domain-containing protein [Alphaproteobacteria bacterium]|nr:MAG: DUF983 domain-containing protein [Alphaproteobacteria bacterium]
MTATDHSLASFIRRPTALVGLLRGLRRKCPHCGNHAAFAGYLKLTPQCAGCGAPLGVIRADDAPPYFTIMVVGHLVVPLLLVIEQMYHPPVWLHMAIWPALAIALTLILLPVIKGGVVGVMWSVGLRGDEHH